VNANVFGAVGSTQALAESGGFPPVFAKPGRVGSTKGLTISTIAVLLLANLVDLSAIASLGSVVALVIFLVGAGHHVRPGDPPTLGQEQRATSRPSSRSGYEVCSSGQG